MDGSIKALQSELPLPEPAPAGQANGSISYIPIGLLLIASIAMGAWLSTRYQIMWAIAGSMEPSISSGDLLIVKRTKGIFHPADARPMVGSVVIIRHEGKYLVKRLVAIGDDIVTVNSKNVVNVRNVSNRELPELDRTIVSRVYVPPNHIYVVGDNLKESVDSRVFGVIPESSIVGVLSAAL